MNTANLISELAKPAYAAMTVAEKVAALQTRSIVPINGANVYVSREQIRAAFNAAEFIALPGQKQNLILAVLASDSIAVEGTDASLIAAAFAGATTTLAALGTLRTNAINNAARSPAEQIGWGGLTDALLTDWINKLGL